MGELYRSLARALVDDIERGLYGVGERLPGVRSLSAAKRVSPTTAVAAYRQLEQEGYIEARARSGFYVARRRQTQVAEPEMPRQSVAGPRLVEGRQRVLRLISAIHDTDAVKLGAAVPDPSFLPERALERALTRAVRLQRREALSYAPSEGLPHLRQQLARRMTAIGCATHADDLVVTNGCQEAVWLALQILTRPGDVVAVETPTFHGHLQALDALGLKVLEIPTHPRAGMSLEALQLATEQWPVKVCLVIPNFSNPLGACMSDEHKQGLIELCHRRGVAIIEDDIYGDLPFTEARPAPLKRFDRHGSVLYCSSFSKALSPGLRIGWISARGWVEQLKYQKFITNVAVPSLPQLAVADYLAAGQYEKHLRGFRRELAASVNRIAEHVSHCFPAETRMTRPSGGQVIWLELPEPVDTLALSEAARERGITIAPGPLFSATDRYRNCLRLSCAVRWDDRTRRALETLGELAYRQSGD